MTLKFASIASHILASPKRMATAPFLIVAMTRIGRPRRTAP